MVLKSLFCRCFLFSSMTFCAMPFLFCLPFFLLYHQSILFRRLCSGRNLIIRSHGPNEFLPERFFLLRNAGNYLDNLEAFLPASFHNVPSQNRRLHLSLMVAGIRKWSFSSLKLRGLNFRYNGCSQYALKNISLTIHKGQHIAPDRGKRSR